MSGRRALPASVAAAAVAVALGGCMGDDGGDRPPPAQIQLRTSWIAGQPPLESLPEFAAIEKRAADLAGPRFVAFQDELKRIAEAKVEAKKKARREALERYREARRRAKRLYEQALRRAALERERQKKRLAALRRKRERELERLRRKLRIRPGEECNFPEVQERFNCKPGQLPMPE